MRTILFSILLFISQILIAQEVLTLVPGPSSFNDGLVLDDQGNIYAARYYGATITKITPTGQTSIFASGLTSPNGITFDKEGNLLVPEATADKVTKIDSAGNKSLFATITNPTNLLYLPDGNLLISAYTQDKISVMDTAGNISDYWTGTELSGGPVGLAYDTIRKELYVGNFDDGKILKKDSLNVVTELADLPGWCGFICEAGDYIYATAYTVHKIYRIAKDGSEVIVFAGTGSPGQVNGDLSIAKFNQPNGIVSSKTGDTLYISDYATRSLRMIVGVNSYTGINNFNENLNGFRIFPNPAKDRIYFELKGHYPIDEVQLFNMNGQLVYKFSEFQYSKKEYSIDLPEFLKSGIYQMKVKSGSSFYNEKLYLE